MDGFLIRGPVILSPEWDMADKVRRPSTACRSPLPCGSGTLIEPIRLKGFDRMFARTLVAARTGLVHMTTNLPIRSAAS